MPIELELHEDGIEETFEAEKSDGIWSLDIDSNHLTSLTHLKGLEKCSRIQELNLFTPLIETYEGLENFVNLKSIYIEETKVEEYSSLTDLLRLVEVKLRNCPMQKYK